MLEQSDDVQKNVAEENTDTVTGWNVFYFYYPYQYIHLEIFMNICLKLFIGQLFLWRFTETCPYK